MRVGFFTESYDPIINGVSTSVNTLVAELVRAGQTPVIVAPHTPGFIDEKRDGVEVIRLPSWRTPLNPENPFAFPPIGLAPALRHLHVDVVHTQQPFGMGMHGRVLAQRLGVPLISTFHTLYTEYIHYFPAAPPALSRSVVTTFLRSHYDACAAVVVPSREAGRRLEQIGIPPGHLHVIPTGVSAAHSVSDSAVEEARAALALPPGAPVLLFVGRVAEEKNLDLLVDSYARLLEQKPTGETPILLIVGSGPHLDTLRERVRALDLEETTRFAGYLNREQLAPVYHLSTLFCFPSISETQGVVLSEAQSYGLPCVVADGGGAPEFVRPGVDALVVPAETIPFADAIRALLRDSVCRAAFAEAASVSPLRPTPAEMSEQVMALYAEVLRST